MEIFDISTRIFNLSGKSSLERIYHMSGDHKLVESEVFYFIRLELAFPGHRELIKSSSDMRVVTPYVNMYGKKEGQITDMSTLLTKFGQFPYGRSELNGTDFGYLFDGSLANVNARLVSSFDGHRDAFGSKFDKLATYDPLIERVLQEFAKAL